VRQGFGSVQKLARPIRAWSQRFAFVALVMMAVALIVLSRANSPLADRMRVHVVDAFSPIFEAVSHPVHAVSGWIADLGAASGLRQENARLQAEIDRLKAAQVKAARIKAENNSLRALLGAPIPVSGEHMAARVIADTSSGFVHSLIINAGNANGVRRGLAVVSTDGLIGRITEAGRRSARVLLITDLNSRISVRIERTRGRAILAGDNSDQPVLLYLTEDEAAHAGDIVVTSGHDGVFPPGIPVGVVVLDGDTVRVKPYANWARLEFVRIIDYRPIGLVPQSADARKRVP
jgi:rod shape-determining protein MreC